MEKALINLNGTRVILPCETRWCSHKNSYESFLTNLSKMQLLATTKPLKSNIKKMLFDDELVEKVQKNFNVLTPVGNLINKCQQSKFSIADAAQEWLQLVLPENFQPILNNRKKMALNIYSLAANFLHPAYNGKLFSEEEKNEVDEFFIENLSADGLMDLFAYNNNEGVFKHLTQKQLVSPIVFWSMAEKKHNTLAKLALRLLKIPAASAQLERVFSNWSFIHSKTRNRLEFDRSKKLLNVYYSLKSRDKNHSEEY
jgi:hypothetical protein